MIIYGTRTKELASEWLNEKCPNCGEPNSLTMHVFQKYAHVFWIPFFPAGKIGISQCSHCQQVLKENKMPPEMKAALKEIKPRTKTPLWMFVGTAISIVVLIVMGATNNL